MCSYIRGEISITAFKNRTSGLLLPIFSLPSNSGIGTLGKSAYDFVRFLKKSGQKYWQILPVCPPAKADSPYLSYSARAGNPYLIDVDWLVGDGWISEDEKATAGIKPAPIDEKSAKKFGSPYASAFIDYDQVKESRNKLFSILYKNFFAKLPDDYAEFCEEHDDWLQDYALFMTLLEEFKYTELHEWPDEYKYRDKQALQSYADKHEYDINYHKMLQYFFYTQWRSLQKFAHENDVKIIGDIPLYVALTSADAWVEPKIFDINEDFSVSVYSGCPPNKAHNKQSKGQIWDSPVYNWDYLKETNYKWWINRIKDALDLYDIVRLDHFKGFEKFYNISAETRDPKTGHWKKGPGFELWEAIAKELGYKKVADLPLFAEDLGIYTPELKELVDKCQFEGMKVIQYAFNETQYADQYIGDKRKDFKNKYLPQNYEKNFVAYVGTHDTNTILGYIDEALPEVLGNCQNYYEETDPHKLSKLMIEDMINSKANICILLVQDLLELAQDARINTPGTVGINWKWQLSDEEFNKLDAKKLLEMTKTSGR